MNIALFHVATVHAGEADEHRSDDRLSAVSYDQSTHYYDLSGLGVTAEDFAAFVAEAWDLDETPKATEWVPGVFRVSLD